MDFDLRQWLLILGPVFIIAVLLHGYLRMRAGQNQIKMKLDRSFVSNSGEEVDMDDLSLLKAELPNGGARVIGSEEALGGAGNVVADETEQVPVLVESVDLPSINAKEMMAVPEAQTRDLIEELEEIQQQSPTKAPPKTPSKAPSEAPSEAPSKAPLGTKKEDELVTPDLGKAPPAIVQEAPAVVQEAPAVVQEAPAVVKENPAMTTEAPGAKESTADASPPPEKFVVINVLALDEPFSGQQLLELLLEAGMTFGEMDIFHKQAGDEIHFSLASAVEPGTFDMKSMNVFQTPGVTMFMRVHELRDPVAVLDDMLNVADSIALELGGEVRDETRSVMTPQTVEHCRQSIREFQFKNSA